MPAYDCQSVSKDVNSDGEVDNEETHPHSQIPAQCQQLQHVIVGDRIGK